MPRRRGRLIRLFLALVVIAAAAAFAVTFVSFPPLKSAAETILSETLGRKVTLTSATLNVIEGPSLLLKSVTAQEDPDFGDGVFFKADDVRAGIDAREYVRTRRLAIDSLSLKSPEFSMIRKSDGAWNWTTLGGDRSAQVAASPRAKATAINSIIRGFLSSVSLLVPSGSATTRSLRRINIEHGSVRLIDRTKTSAAETLYRNITLNVSLEPNASDGVITGTRAKGELSIESGNDDSTAELFNVELPFELLISDSTPLEVRGAIGPGPLETRNLKVGGLQLTGDLHAEREKPLSATGQLSGREMFISTMNLSERVSRAVNVNEIGDMSPGTKIGSLETAFNVDQGTINTTNLRVQQVDGLGDASADKGSFKVDSSLTVNYAATVTLSPDATTRIKSAGPIIGLLATLLESNNRLSVPVSISGDLRQPDVRVDVSRIF